MNGKCKKYKLRNIVPLFFFLLCFFVDSIDAQQGEKRKGQGSAVIAGKVFDDENLPLPGVTVLLKGTHIGTATAADGSYRIKCPDCGPGSTLVFSFIGMQSKEIEIAGRKTIDVTLEFMDAELDEIVVTGYFKQKKESFTGSAQTLTSEELLQADNQNILSAVQLVEPSFMQLENTLDGSNPNVMPDFQVRGDASVDMRDDYEGNPNMPTFILDGFEVDVETVYDMDPYQVKSITILKDAAATAIYGSRAANGVVVIETLIPEAGKMLVSYKGDFTFSVADFSFYDLLNAEEKLDLEKKAGLYDYTESSFVSNIEKLQKSYNEKLKLVEQGFNTYWLNKPVEETISQKHTLSLEGGQDEIRYGIDLNYNDQKGIMKESGRKRIGLGIKLQYTYKNLVFRNKLTYVNVNRYNSPYGNFSSYAQLNPYYRYTNDLGEYLYVLEETSDATVYNPLYNTTLNMINESRYDNLINNFDIDWRITDNLRLRGAFSIDKRTDREDVFKPGLHTDFANVTDINKKGSYFAKRGEQLDWETTITLNYFKHFAKHVVNANGIFNAQQDQSEWISLLAQGFPNEDMNNATFAIQYEEAGRPNGDEYTSRQVGFSGNVNYSYDSRYLMDLSFRVDGSSAFGADKRWAPFWSAGLGWNLHHEKFFKGSDVVNELKIRGSYGSTGSVTFNPYQAMMMYQYSTDLAHRFETGATLIALGNENLSWQQTKKRNVALDFKLLSNRLSGTVEYYSDLSENLLIDVDLAPSLGFVQYKENLGKVRNEGYEVRLRYQILKNSEGVNWSVFGSAAHNENTLLELSNSLEEFNAKQDAEITDPEEDQEDEISRPRVRYVEGQSMSAIWANKSLGIDPATGNEIFVTKNGGTTLEWSTDNLMVCGDSEADLLGNFGTNFFYKGFMLNVIFQYRIGGQQYNYLLADRVENANFIYNTDRRVLEDRWENPGDVTFYKDVKDDSPTKPTSRFIQDYSYLNLSSVNASYEFAPSVAQKLSLERLKILFYMNDIFRTSTVKREEGTTYPFSRSFSLALQARF